MTSNTILLIMVTAWLFIGLIVAVYEITSDLKSFKKLSLKIGIWDIIRYIVIIIFGLISVKIAIDMYIKKHDKI